MRYLTIKPKQNATHELAIYVRDAYAFARDFKAEKQAVIEQIDKYFTELGKRPTLLVSLNCEEVKSKDCGQGQVEIKLDAIGHKVDTFVAVATDAVVQVDKPWLIEPTAHPEFPKSFRDDAANAIIEVIGNNAAQLSGGDPNIYYSFLLEILQDKDGLHDYVRQLRDGIYNTIDAEVKRRADATAKLLDTLVFDDMQESNWDSQFDSFIYHFAKYDFAVIKTPEWVMDYKEVVTGHSVKEVKTTILKHECIHPKDYYCSEDSTFDYYGSFEMDVSTISLNDLLSCKGFDGFIDSQIDEVCTLFSEMDREWLNDDYELVSGSVWRGYEHIKVIKYSGKVDCAVLQDWVSTKDKKLLKDKLGTDKSYECTLWVIHDYVVYAKVSLSKIVRRPYKVATYSRRGSHKYDGQGIYSLCFEYQTIIDRFAAMAMENASLAAGGVIGYNQRKIEATDFKPEDIRGGARIPVKSTIMDGGNDRPIFEIRFDSHISELLGVILQMESKMDERSQIPSSSIGFTSKLSSVRSTGIATLNQANVNKAVIRKIIQIEKPVIKPLVLDLVSYHIWHTDDPRILEGAVDIKVEGYSGLIRKQDRQQNLDLVMQNMIGLQNAINQMRAQGQDVGGLVDLAKRYVEMAGFDGDKFFAGQAQLTNGLVNQVGSALPQTDGRSEPPMNSEIALQ